MVFFVGLVSSLLMFAQQSLLPAAVGFAPGDWPKQDLERYSNLQHPDAYRQGELPTSATSSKAMIVSTTEPLAIHSGFEALRHGGNAMDAALTTSLAQISLSTGAAYSYAGIMLAVYYDASSGKVYTLNAAYNTVKGETDPMSIPAFGQHSGRTALVPGFEQNVPCCPRGVSAPSAPPAVGPRADGAEGGAQRPCSGRTSTTTSSGRQRNRRRGAGPRSIPTPRETTRVRPPPRSVTPAVRLRGTAESVMSGPMNGSRTWPPWVWPATRRSASTAPSEKSGP